HLCCTAGSAPGSPGVCRASGRDLAAQPAADLVLPERLCLAGGERAERCASVTAGEPVEVAAHISLGVLSLAADLADDATARQQDVEGPGVNPVFPPRVLLVHPFGRLADELCLPAEFGFGENRSHRLSHVQPDGEAADWLAGLPGAPAMISDPNSITRHATSA